MRGAMIHGVLLAVMLVYGYRTWTRDKTAAPVAGSVALWDKSEGDLVSIEYKAPKKIVKLERRDGYWWGIDTTIEMKPKAKPPEAGSDAGSAGSGSGSGSGAKPPIEEEEVGRKTREFPPGDTADKLIKELVAAHALRDLGVPNDDAKKDYKLTDAKTTLTVTFKDGPKTFLIGGLVYGGADRYAVDQGNGKAYVLSKDLLSGLESGETNLHLMDPRGFELDKIDQIAIDAAGKSKVVARIETETDGQKRKTWADVETKLPNQTAANFVDNANNLKPSEYSATLKISDLTPVLKLTYRDARSAVLGTLSLYKHDKPGQLGSDQELDPANPPKGETEYYVVTERTHIPGLVRKDTAQRMENDIETVFSSKPSDATGSGSGSAVHSIDPHGNPFGKATKGALAPTPPVPPGPTPPMPPPPSPPGPPTKK